LRKRMGHINAGRLISIVVLKNFISVVLTRNKKE
jgi:hypothetical protein